MRFLIFGDIVGKIGRRTLVEIIPELRSAYRPDAIIANAENIAHGLGMTEKTVREVLDAGVTLLTGGNDMWKKEEGVALLDRDDSAIIRPANYPAGVPGRGWKMLSVAEKNVLVINLMGRVFIRDLVDNPFLAFDAVLKERGSETTVVLVDYHGEATSERSAFGWYADGRASVVYGTHTHIPTADQRILPRGTAFITDVGMTGLRDSVIGVDAASVIPQYTTGIGQKFVWPETGVAWVNAIIVDVDPANGRATHIERIQRELTIT